MLADVAMKKSSQLRCTCVHCDQFIEYSPSEIGQIAECTHCQQKSLLPPAPTPPPPPLPATAASAQGGSPSAAAPRRPAPRPSNRRQNPVGPNSTKLLLIVAAAIIVIGAVILLPRLRHRQPDPLPVVAAESVGPLPQPKIKRPKSLNDLKIGSFSLQTQRDSEVRIVFGDIHNDSETVHRDVKVDLDLHDAQGLKIGSLDAFIKELGPHAIWHVLAKTSEPRAATVRVVGLREQP